MKSERLVKRKKSKKWSGALNEFMSVDVLTIFRFRGTSDNDSFFTPHNISGGGRLSRSLDILLEHIVAGGRAWWQVRFIHFITTLLWD